MTLITRFSRLFCADVHALLDRIEEPDVLLRQSIREMEEALDIDRRRSLVLAHEREQLTASEAELQHSLQAIQEELALCLDAGKDDLAKSSIKRKLESERDAKALAVKRAGLEAEWSDAQARLLENRLRLESIRQKAEALTQGHGYREESLRREGGVSDDEIEVAFLRERQKRGAS